ncbi:helix-turn-helix transcriptional regulator [Dermacoccus nishinomiyaensis]
MTKSSFQPIAARTCTVHRPLAPVAYDCVKIIVIRNGSAFFLSEFGQQPVNVGDVVLLGANVLCGAEPEGHFTTTTLYVDTDYFVDLVFWRHANLISDRLDAYEFTNTLYTDPAQILHLGEARAGMLMPWLDEMTALSVDGQERQKFHRVQALWFSILDVIDPYVHVSPVRVSNSQRARSRPTWPRGRRFAPLRDEARTVHDALHADPHRTWHLPELADMVFLSTRQLASVFADAYGKTPLAYLTMLRVQEMAKLIRETNLPISDIAHQVGWQSRNRASEAFKTCIGVTPAEYRAQAKKLASGALTHG